MTREKTKQLGLHVSTANQRLRKNIMFQLAQICELDTCFRCGRPIYEIDEFTIDHKIPWLHSEDPVELFFNFDNIAFSHYDCNVRHRRPQRSKKKA